MQFDDFFCYKDIDSKEFFTMATLLMPLLGNEVFNYIDSPDCACAYESTYVLKNIGP